MNLTQKIEGYLFYKSEPMTIKKIAQFFSASEGEINDGLRELEEGLTGRGLVLMRNGDAVQLATHPDLGPILEEARKQELSDPLSKGAMETLTIILYKDGATKTEIDFIRGVNSGFMLRNLLIRGLIEKIPNDEDKRVSKYRATFETLQYLGITSISELPNREHFLAEFAKREEVKTEESNPFTE